MRELAAVMALAAAGCLGTSETARPTSLRSVKLPLQVVKLDNGLQLLLNEDHRVPVVAVDVAYGVGWSDDPPNRTELAHTFEHLMFQGSAHVAPNAHSQYLERAGSLGVGATTTPDMTEFFATVPANQLELALWLESDRMGFLVDGLDQQKLERVRPVLDNELRERQDNAVGGRVGQFLLAALFPAGHPYHGSGAPSTDVTAITAEDARRFGRSYYLPNNASLALSGDFDPATAVALVDRYFGSLPPGPPPAHAACRPVELSRATRLDVAAKVAREQVWIAWPTPGLGQAGDAELGVAAFILSQALLRPALVEEVPIAVAARARQHSWQRAGAFAIEVELRPGWHAEHALAAIDRQLRHLREPAISEAWTDLASRGLSSDGLADLQTVAGRARALNRYAVLLHAPNYLWRDIHRYDSIRPSAVTAAVERYLPVDKRVLLVVHVDPSAPVGGRLMRTP